MSHFFCRPHIFFWWFPTFPFVAARPLPVLFPQFLQLNEPLLAASPIRCIKPVKSNWRAPFGPSWFEIAPNSTPLAHWSWLLRIAPIQFHLLSLELSGSFHSLLKIQRLILLVLIILLHFPLLKLILEKLLFFLSLFLGQIKHELGVDHGVFDQHFVKLGKTWRNIYHFWISFHRRRTKSGHLSWREILGTVWTNWWQICLQFDLSLLNYSPTGRQKAGKTFQGLLFKFFDCFVYFSRLEPFLGATWPQSLLRIIVIVYGWNTRGVVRRRCCHSDIHSLVPLLKVLLFRLILKVGDKLGWHELVHSFCHYCRRLFLFLVLNAQFSGRVLSIIRRFG